MVAVLIKCDIVGYLIHPYALGHQSYCNDPFKKTKVALEAMRIFPTVMSSCAAWCGAVEAQQRTRRVGGLLCGRDTVKLG